MVDLTQHCQQCVADRRRQSCSARQPQIICDQRRIDADLVSSDEHQRSHGGILVLAQAVDEPGAPYHTPDEHDGPRTSDRVDADMTRLPAALSQRTNADVVRLLMAPLRPGQGVNAHAPPSQAQRGVMHQGFVRSVVGADRAAGGGYRRSARRRYTPGPVRRVRVAVRHEMTTPIAGAGALTTCANG